MNEPDPDGPDETLDVEPEPATPQRWSFEAGAAIARARAGGRCEVCGIERDNQTHHRQARGMGGVHRDGLAVNRPSCLLRVCTSCHARIESHREWARRRGLLVPRPTDPAAVPVRLRTANGAGWWLLTGDGCYDWCDLPDEHSVLAA